MGSEFVTCIAHTVSYHHSFCITFLKLHFRHAIFVIINPVNPSLF